MNLASISVVWRCCSTEQFGCALRMAFKSLMCFLTFFLAAVEYCRHSPRLLPGIGWSGEPLLYYFAYLLTNSPKVVPSSFTSLSSFNAVIVSDDFIPSWV